MPLYEFVCRSCEHPFEELVRHGTEPRCPRCDTTDVHRILSVVSVGRREAAAPAASAAPCGTCGDPRGAGSCRLG